MNGFFFLLLSTSFSFSLSFYQLFNISILSVYTSFCVHPNRSFFPLLSFLDFCLLQMIHAPIRFVCVHFINHVHFNRNPVFFLFRVLCSLFFFLSTFFSLVFLSFFSSSPKRNRQKKNRPKMNREKQYIILSKSQTEFE